VSRGSAVVSHDNSVSTSHFISRDFNHAVSVPAPRAKRTIGTLERLRARGCAPGSFEGRLAFPMGLGSRGLRAVSWPRRQRRRMGRSNFGEEQASLPPGSLSSLRASGLSAAEGLLPAEVSLERFQRAERASSPQSSARRP
jgi:hypothetical protein